MIKRLLKIFVVLLTSAVHANDLSQEMNFTHQPGRHTKRSPVVGSRLKEIKVLQESEDLQPFLDELEQALYCAEYIYLIPTDKKDAADAVAKRLFNEYIAKYQKHGVNESNAVRWMQTGNPGLISNKTLVIDVENAWNTWCVEAIIEERNGTANEKYGAYLPPHLVAYHELMHVEETQAGQSSQERNTELLTGIKTILLADLVYKEIHGLALDSEVDYGKTVTLFKRQWSLGALANKIRALEALHNNLAEALVSNKCQEIFLATSASLR